MTTATTSATIHQLNEFRPTIDSDTAIYIAPRRFDVHATEHVSHWAENALATHAAIVIDLQMVDFIDQHMIDTLADIAAKGADRGVRVATANLSAAAELTFHLLERAAA